MSPGVIKVSIEVGIAQGWRELIGDSGVAISLEHYGASADAKKLFKEFGFSVDNVVAQIVRSNTGRFWRDNKIPVALPRRIIVFHASATSFASPGRTTSNPEITGADPYGRIIHFGIR